MRYNLKTFARVMVSLPQHPEVKKIYSYAERKVYINENARPGANVILYEAPNVQQVPVRPEPWRR